FAYETTKRRFPRTSSSIASLRLSSELSGAWISRPSSLSRSGVSVGYLAMSSRYFRRTFESSLGPRRCTKGSDYCARPPTAVQKKNDSAAQDDRARPDRFAIDDEEWAALSLLLFGETRGRVSPTLPRPEDQPRRTIAPLGRKARALGLAPL